MNSFLIAYSAVAFFVIVAVFLLSLNENKSHIVKTALTIVYVLAFIGVIFAMTVLEGKYSMSRLISSGIAAATIGLMYLADTFAGKLA